MCIALIERGHELVHILLGLVDLGQEMSGQGPVLLHDSHRGLHAAGHQLFQEPLEGVQRGVVCRIEGLTGDLLDRIRIIDQSARFHTYGEAHYLPVHGQGILGVLHPFFTAQIRSVISCQGVHVFCVHHGKGVGIVGRIFCRQVRRYGIIGIIDLHVHTGRFAVLLRHLLELCLDLDLRVKDRDRHAVAAAACCPAAVRGGSTAACYKRCCHDGRKCSC